MSNPIRDTPKWYCIRSTVGYESRAAEFLLRLSPDVLSDIGTLEVYCPQIRKMMPVGGKRRAVLASLFPGYFFAAFCLETAARFVASRPGVIGLVRFGELPVTVSREVIQELKLTYSETEPELVLGTFVPGQKLVILDGPFMGMEAEYVTTLSDGHRALLLLEYLHRRVNVIAECQVLESAA